MASNPGFKLAGCYRDDCRNGAGVVDSGGNMFFDQYDTSYSVMEDPASE
jgi:hypothetical protein